MKELEKYISGLRNRSLNASTVIIKGTAKNVTEDKCDVHREGSPILEGVKFKVLDDVADYIVTIPKEGSEVLVAMADNNAQGYLISCSEIKKVIVKIGQVEFVINKDGYKIKKAGESLKKILDDMIDAIMKITVPTSTGPSGIPINAAAFEIIKERVNTIFI